ncbi:hypothetical protein DBR06_SOUSAS6910246, partial [Sousa chinensis]
KGCGNMQPTRCTNCAQCVPKGKSIKKFIIQGLPGGAVVKNLP